MKKEEAGDGFILSSRSELLHFLFFSLYFICLYLFNLITFLFFVQMHFIFVLFNVLFLFNFQCFDTVKHKCYVNKSVYDYYY